MDPQRFDDLARRLSTRTSRRGLLRGVAGGLAGVLLRQELTEAKGGCRKLGKRCSEDDECCSGACDIDARGRGHCDGCPDLECGENEYFDPRDCTCRCAYNRDVCGDGEICTPRGCQCPDGQKPCAGDCIDENACCTVDDCPPSNACFTSQCVGRACAGEITPCTIGPGSGPCEIASCDPSLGCVTTNLPANEPGRCSDGSVCCDDGTCHDLNSVDNCGACGNACEPPDSCTPAACDGGVCQTESACVVGQECLDGTCTPVLGAIGDACSRSSDTDYQGTCGDDLYCYDDNKCALRCIREDIDPCISGRRFCCFIGVLAHLSGAGNCVSSEYGEEGTPAICP